MKPIIIKRPSDPGRILESPESFDLMAMYMKDVGNHPNMSDADQIRLFALLDEAQPDRLSQPFVRIPDNCKEIVTEIASYHYKLVIAIAGKYKGQWPHLPDLVSEGNIGLLRSIWSFDPAKGTKLNTYATWWVRQTVGRAVVEKCRTIRVPVHMNDRWRRVQKAIAQLLVETGDDSPDISDIAEHLGKEPEAVAEIIAYMVGTETVTLDAPPINSECDVGYYNLIAADVDGAEEDAIRADLKRRVAAAIETLDAREQRVICYRFGLNGHEEHTLEQCGRKFGLTRERIRQIEGEALKKLRHPRRSRALRGFI